MASKLKATKFIKQIAKSKITRRIGLGFGIFLVAFSLLFFFFNLSYRDKIFPHTFIGGTNFGGLKRAEAQGILDGLENENQSASLYFTFQDKIYELKIADMDVDWQKENQKTLDSLFAVGRRGSPQQVLKENFRAIFHSNQIFASFNFNSSKLDEFVEGIAKDIDYLAKDAQIIIKDNKPEVVPEEIGQRFPQDTNKKIALDTIGSFNFRSSAKFLVEKVYPKITALGARMALDKTEALLSSHLILKAGEKTFQLYPTDIASMIDFVTQYGKRGVLGVNSSSGTESLQEMVVAYSLSPEISKEKITAFIDKIASEVDQPAQDPKFEVTDGRVQTFQTAQTGYELDKEKAMVLIIDALDKGEVTVELPIKVTEPKLASSDPSQIGIKELIGEGRTSWRGSPANRIHNLTLGANRISGTIVKPGEEFSTLSTLGEIGPSTGYLQELVIKNGNQVEPDYGGGLCQVSTTLFRAVIYSGLKVTARTPHSFRVSYYEPPVGMDATVFEPAPDFKFVNDMQTPILIWAIAGNNSLVFQMYGTKDGRKIEISDPVIGNYTSPGGDIYTESATMAPGAIRQVERALSGATASFTYKVTDASGNVLENETYVSKYVPVPNSFLYGPGTTGIPGQEQAPAPEPTPVTSPTPTPKPSPTKSVKH